MRLILFTAKLNSYSARQRLTVARKYAILEHLDMISFLHSRQINRRVVSRVMAMAFLIALVLIAGCSAPQKPAATPTKTEPPKAESAEKTKPKKDTVTTKFKTPKIHWLDENGVPVWNADAKTGSALDNGKKTIVELKRVKGDMFQDGKLVSKLTAPSVVGDNSTREIKATGGAKVVSVVNGTIVTCRELVWKARENKFYGTGDVKVTRQNATITSNRFVADTGLKKIEFMN